MKEYVLTLSEQAMQVVLAALAEAGPYRVIVPVVKAITEQIIAQDRAERERPEPKEIKSPPPARPRKK